MRLGDYIILGNLTLNVLAILFYGVEGHWKMVGYWAAVAQLNAWLVAMR